MAAISNLTEEILLMIFKHLHVDQMAQLQHVCKAWYLPAHTTLLSTIELEVYHQIRSFIASIDYNPKPSYLKAVKSISFEREYVANDDLVDLNKLFFRFTNLTEVKFAGSINIVKQFMSCATYF